MSALRDHYMDHCHECGAYMEPEEIDDNEDTLCAECKQPPATVWVVIDRKRRGGWHREGTFRTREAAVAYCDKHSGEGDYVIGEKPASKKDLSLVQN